MLPPPPSSPLFPYTTLFRSSSCGGRFRSTDQQFFPICTRAGRASFEHSLACRLEKTVDRKSTRLNSSHRCISYAVFCLKKKKKKKRLPNLAGQMNCTDIDAQ